ncbi:MAG: hypothetical protein WC332_03400 [Clostridia bacterium]|jgi:predicted HNH restriction endonuclease
MGKKNTKTAAYKAGRRRHYARNRLKRQDVMDKLKVPGCSLCGYSKCNNALEFHHINPDKERKPSQAGTITSLLKEVSKCILVCANCHREIHAGQIESLSHVETVKVRKQEEPPLLRLINS